VFKLTSLILVVSGLIGLSLGAGKNVVGAAQDHATGASVAYDMPILHAPPKAPVIPKNTRGYPAPPITIHLLPPIRRSFYAGLSRLPLWQSKLRATPPVLHVPEPSTLHSVATNFSGVGSTVQRLGSRTVGTLATKPLARMGPLVVDTSHIWAKYFDNIGYGPPNGYKYTGGTNPGGYTTIYAGYNPSDPPVTIKIFVNGKQVSWQCGWANGLIEAGITLPEGASVVTVEMTDANNNTYDSNQVWAYFDPGDGSNLPQPADQNACCIQSGDPASDSNGADTTVPGSSPVNIVTGELWDEHRDIQLEGPFGLEFDRWYHSGQAYDGFMTADLGPGWRHNYDAAINVSNIANGQATFYDETGDTVYFGGLAPGTTIYEQMAGYTLVMNSDSTFKLTTWHGKAYTFDSSGRLTSISDRNGNVQTVVRNTSNPNEINYVSDALGRRLTFSYDSSARIIGVTSTPGGASVTFSYTAATNCIAGDLCKVTEADNSVWSYQYSDVYDGYTGQNFHLLSEVLDPLNHVVEQQTYGLATDGRFWAATQQTDSGQNSLTFNYTGHNNTVTDGNSRTTTYQVDQYNNLVDSVQGPLCKCAGAQSMNPGYGGFQFNFMYGPVAEPFMRRTDYCVGTSGCSRETQYTYGNDAFLAPADGTTPYVETAYREATVRHDILASTGPPYPTDRYTYPTYFQPNGPAGVGNPLQDLVQTVTQDSVDTSGKYVVTTNVYNAGGLLTSQSVQGYVGGVQQTITTQSSWDSRGRLLTTTGPRTDVTQKTTYLYYPDNGSDLATDGQLQTVTDAVGNVTTYGTGATGSYNIYGEALSITDPNNVKTTITYDALGRKLTAKLNGTIGGISNPTTTWTYDLAGNTTKKAMPLGNAIAYGYDTNNRVLTTTTLDKSALQHDQTVFVYDNMGQKTSKTYKACNTPATTCAAWTTKASDSYKYDSFGRLSEVDHPDGTKIVKGYDPVGELTSIQDEDHSSANITYSYDLAGRLLSETDVLSTAPGGHVTTSYTYDELNHRVSTTDPNTNITTVSYDDFGRKHNEVSPVSGTTSYAYNPAADLTSMTDADGNQRTYTYDVLDRMLTEVATFGSQHENISFTYDTGTYGKGHLASMTDPSGSTTYTYEQRGLVTQEAVTIQSNAYTINHGYDGNGNENSTTYPDAKIITHTFDWADRPITTKQGSTTFVSAVSYEPFGPAIKLTFGNGTSQTFSYDQRYRVTEDKYVKSATLADYKYMEDSVGNITQIHDALNAGYNRDLGYDDINRLITANSGASLWGGSSGYTYDSMGNMKTATLGSVKVDTFAYSGTLPKLTSVTENGTPRSVVYDSDGNETQVGTAMYTYSARSLLATGDGNTYTYDGRGVRDITATSGGVRYSFYDAGKRLLSESAVTSSGKPAIAYDYIWLGGRPVGEIGTSATQWTFADHLGTAQIQASSTGVITYQAEYEPFGRVFSLRSGDLHQPLRLPGQVAEQFDTGINGSTEKSYNVNRWYRGPWGRYTQGDPEGLAAGTNLYAYASANPILDQDPSGLNALIAFDPTGAGGIGNSSGFGHVFIIIYNPTTLTAQSFSYNATPQSLFGAGLVKEQDYTSVHDVPPNLLYYEVDTSADQDQAMIAAANSWADQAAIGSIGQVGPVNVLGNPFGTQYALIGHSCVNFTQTVLAAGGQTDYAQLISIWPSMSVFNFNSAGLTATDPHDIQPK
jgi:RHS repeat-associated protein